MFAWLLKFRNDTLRDLTVERDQLSAERARAYDDIARYKLEVIELKDKLADEHRHHESRLADLNVEMATIQHKKEMELADLQHTVRMREEALNVEHQKRCLENDRKRDEEISAVKDDYTRKHEAQLSKEASNLRGMYSEVLERLPSVSVRQKDTRNEQVHRYDEGKD